MKPGTWKIPEFTKAPFDNMVVFDLETTGLAHEDDITQVAAVRILNGDIKTNDSFFSYMKPRQPVSAYITQLTGVTEADVADAPLPDIALADFSDYCGDSLLVAHNAQRFDIPFVQRVCTRYKIPTRKIIFLDSIHLSRNVWKNPNLSHSLDAVIGRLGLSMENIQRHDARGDVEITAQAVCQMIATLTERNKPIALQTFAGVLPKVTHQQSLFG
jgi:DNA polymerase III subunit epsilon